MDTAPTAPATTCRPWPFVSVIVVGYNSLPHLDTCLAALEQQHYESSVEILFVDNASRDESLAYVAEHFPRVRAIALRVNRGYAGGNNVGAWAAHGDILIFLNPDTEASPNAIRELVRPLKDDTAVGMTTPVLVLFDRRDRINTAGNTIHLSGLTTCRLAGKPVADVDDAEVAAVSGACCAIRRELFEGIGGFDERFFMYLEDTDLSWRVRLAGYSCHLAARALVAHRYQLSLDAEKTFWLERNRYQMLAKNLSLRAGLALLPMLLAAEVVTFGWATLQGSGHIAAKFRAYAGTLRNWRSLLAARRDVQRLRRSPDRDILVAHTVLVPFTDATEGIIARYMSRITRPLCHALGQLALRLAGTRVQESTQG